MSSDQDMVERLDAANKKLDLLIIILLANSGMKLSDISKTVGLSVRTIQRMIPVSKLKCPQDRRVQMEVGENLEPENAETQNNHSKYEDK